MARILLIGPDKDRAADLRSWLRQEGHLVTWERRADGWQEREREIRAEVVVAAVEPGQRLAEAGRRPGRGFLPPLLLIQRETELGGGESNLDDRLVDHMGFPFAGDEFLGRVDALVRVHQVVCGEGGVRAGGTDDDAAGGWRTRLAGWLRSRLPRPDKPSAPYLEVASRVAEWVDRRDAFRPGHAERVASFCSLIAGTLEMGERESAQLLRAALLHDIGKIALPVEMLHQRDPLEESQRRLIRTHPARGAALLRALDPDDSVVRMVLYHHECPNGKGYYGKEGAAVPRGALVLAVAEAFDAMTTCLLHEPLSQTAALDQLSALRGDRYDGEAVDALAGSLAPRSAGGGIPLSVC